MIVEIAVVEMTSAAMANAPMYIAVTKAKKRAKNPPAAAKDIRRETTTALKVATKKKSIKTSNPVKARRVIVPTCSKRISGEKFINYKSELDQGKRTPFYWHLCVLHWQVLCEERPEKWIEGGRTLLYITA